MAKGLLGKLGHAYEEKMLGKDFHTPDEMFEEIGKQVRTMPQIMIDDKLIGGYNQLVEHFTDKGEVNYKGEKINEEFVAKGEQIDE
jgi:glutaredoxin